jgi:hypothetical protein
MIDIGGKRGLHRRPFASYSPGLSLLAHCLALVSHLY